MLSKSWDIFTGLGACNNVMTLEDCRKAVLLNWGRDGVSSELDILKHSRVKTSLLEA